MQKRDSPALLQPDSIHLDEMRGMVIVLSVDDCHGWLRRGLVLAFSLSVVPTLSSCLSYKLVFFSSMIAERHEGLHETARERKIRPLIRNKEYITGYKLQLKTSKRTTRRSKEVTTEKNKIKRVFVSRIGSQDKRNIPLLARSIIWKQEKVKGFFFLPFENILQTKEKGKNT